MPKSYNSESEVIWKVKSSGIMQSPGGLNLEAKQADCNWALDQGYTNVLMDPIPVLSVTYLNQSGQHIYTLANLRTTYLMVLYLS